MRIGQEPCNPVTGEPNTAFVAPMPWAIAYSGQRTRGMTVH
ncbi:hypothetical protein RKE25_11390 [Dyella sp. BiH032]|nr:hypothetical protein [Dyella sp. BiH032]WNL44033.1 hypothetical protein RKE25_11390 [Dyella sp. BiH032]